MSIHFPLLLVDMDGPLAGLDDAFFDICTRNGWKLDIKKVSDQRHRFISEHIPDPEHRAKALEMLDGEGFFRELPVVPGAREGMQKLLAHELEIWLCTKPLETSSTSRDEKAAWVREHFPEFNGRIIMAPDKSLAKGDVLLDDAIPLNWIGRSYWSPIVFTMPYNQKGSEWEDLPHFSWDDPISDLVGACAQAHARKTPRTISRHRDRTTRF